MKSSLIERIDLLFELAKTIFADGRPDKKNELGKKLATNCEDIARVTTDQQKAECMFFQQTTKLVATFYAINQGESEGDIKERKRHLHDDTLLDSYTQELLKRQNELIAIGADNLHKGRHDAVDGIKQMLYEHAKGTGTAKILCAGEDPLVTVPYEACTYYMLKPHTFGDGSRMDMVLQNLHRYKPEKQKFPIPCGLGYKLDMTIELGYNPVIIDKLPDSKAEIKLNCKWISLPPIRMWDKNKKHFMLMGYLEHKGKLYDRPWAGSGTIKCLDYTRIPILAIPKE